jgi:hypothetical protein
MLRIGMIDVSLVFMCLFNDVYKMKAKCTVHFCLPFPFLKLLIGLR